VGIHFRAAHFPKHNGVGKHVATDLLKKNRWIRTLLVFPQSFYAVLTCKWHNYSLHYFPNGALEREGVQFESNMHAKGLIIMQYKDHAPARFCNTRLSAPGVRAVL
jgi:hypothetical protein